jgi:hypothetical protein
LRKLRLAAPAQLTLGIPGLMMTPVDRWWSLPLYAQETVVTILARMITEGVIDEEVSVDDLHC